MKNILFAASECVPFIKTGGLADVVGSLPKYFDKKKYDVRVVLPKYSCMNQKWKDQLEYMDHFYMNFFHAFLKLTISLLKNKSAQTFLFLPFREEQKKILVKP